MHESRLPALSRRDALVCFGIEPRGRYTCFGISGAGYFTCEKLHFLGEQSKKGMSELQHLHFLDPDLQQGKTFI